jgi:hypothetical protein
MNDLILEVKESLGELARARRSELRLQNSLDRAVAPHEQEYLEKIKSFQEEFNPKLNRVREKISTLEEKISAELIEVAQDGVVIPRVEADGIIAEATATTRRTVNSQEFCKLVPPNQRDIKFYQCLSVLVGKATKLLGDKIDSIATIKKSWKVKIYREKNP